MQRNSFLPQNFKSFSRFLFSAILIFASTTILVVTCAASSFVQADDGITIVPYTFPDYNEALKKTGVKDYATREEYAAAIADKQFVFQKIQYKSDGLNVVAYIYKPVSISEGSRPVIIFNRGSAIRSDIAPELIVFFHRLAEAGFVIVAPMLRQSDGSEGRDEIGGSDVDDIANLMPVIRSMKGFDQNNIFMYGESRGGMMTYQSMRKHLPIRAAAVFGAFTDMRELVESHPTQYPRANLVKMFDKFETESEKIFESRSAMNWAAELATPILIMHGGGDWSVNPLQSLRLAEKLQTLGKPYELVIYAGDDHTISRNQLDRDRRAIEWFETHMTTVQPAGK